MIVGKWAQSIAKKDLVGVSLIASEVTNANYYKAWCDMDSGLKEATFSEDWSGVSMQSSKKRKLQSVTIG